MTDYRFVSNPDVVLFTYGNPNGGTYWATRDRYLTEFGPEQCDVLIKLGIIEPVPVEIPDHVVEAAARAAYAEMYGVPLCGWDSAAPIDRDIYLQGIRAALIAAKQAEADER